MAAWHGRAIIHHAHTHTHTHSSHARLSLLSGFVARTMRRPASHTAAPHTLQLRCCSFLSSRPPAPRKEVGLGCVWGVRFPVRSSWIGGMQWCWPGGIRCWVGPRVRWRTPGSPASGPPHRARTRISYHLVQRSVGPGLGAGGLGGLCVPRMHIHTHSHTHRVRACCNGLSVRRDIDRHWGLRTRLLQFDAV